MREMKLMTPFGGGPIPITLSGGGQCVATPGAAELDYPATNTALQWKSRTGNPYVVTFKAYQDPSDPNNPNPTPISVLADGTPSKAISVVSDAQTACSSNQACVFEYTVTPPAAGACMGQIGSFGIIVKPTQ